MTYFKKIIFSLIFSLIIFTNNSFAVDITDQLIKLSNLYEKGMITKEEFEKAKSIILEMVESQQKKITKAEEDKKKAIDKIEKDKKKKQKITKKVLKDKNIKDKNIIELEEGIKIRKFSNDYNKKDFEKMELVIGDYRFYTSRPGGIKITKISTRTQLAVIGDKQNVKYYNNGRDILEVIEDKESLDLVVKLNDSIVLRWSGKYVEKHRAHFYQVLAMGYQPFHYYVKLRGKTSIGLNMESFERKIELKLVTVKEKLAKEYNVTVEQINEIIKKRNLASLGSKAEDDVNSEIEKTINESIEREIEKELVDRLEATIGQALSRSFIGAIEQATNEAIDQAVETELAAAIDQAIQEAIAEGISEAAISAGLKAFLDALASGSTYDDAINAGNTACEAHGGC